LQTDYCNFLSQALIENESVSEESLSDICDAFVNQIIEYVSIQCIPLKKYLACFDGDTKDVTSTNAAQISPDFDLIAALAVARLPESIGSPVTGSRLNLNCRICHTGSASSLLFKCCH